MPRTSAGSPLRAAPSAKKGRKRIAGQTEMLPAKSIHQIDDVGAGRLFRSLDPLALLALLTVNLKTAKALGLDVPSSVRLRADDVME